MVWVTPAASTMTTLVSSTRTTRCPFESGSPVFTKASDPLSLIIAVNTVVPSITLPVFNGANGLPVGAQIIGRHYDDRRLLAMEQWIYNELMK